MDTINHTQGRKRRASPRPYADDWRSRACCGGADAGHTVRRVVGGGGGGGCLVSLE